MRKLESLLGRIADVNINVKGKQVTLLTAEEITEFVNTMYDAKYTNRSQAKKLTNLSYIGSVNASAKIMKGLKMDYHTYIVYLSPYKSLFGNVCAKGEHCHKPCLNTSGRVKMDVKEYRILRARYLRTILWFTNRDFFCRWMFDEIASEQAKHENFMVRLNGTSDLSPVLFTVDGVNVLDAFPQVQFYDYTKIFTRLSMVNKYNNYHLTFSFDGYNMKECKIAQSLGINVSVVIDGKMPSRYLGVDMFSMDETDLRPLDKAKGSFGYLKLKETLNKDYDTAFVVKL